MVFGVRATLAVSFYTISVLLSTNNAVYRGDDLSTYRDQTDMFFESPLSYFEATFPRNVDPEFPRSPYPASIPGMFSAKDSGGEPYPWRHTWPRYLVFFGTLLERPEIKEFLEGKGYTEVWKKGRIWEGEGERRGGVRVWTWQS
jgi:phosphatidylinositol glycan class B